MKNECVTSAPCSLAPGTCLHKVKTPAETLTGQKKKKKKAHSMHSLSREVYCTPFAVVY